MIVDTSGATLTDYLERTRASALVVVRDGVLVHEQYLQGAMADDVHLTWSVSKSIVSTIAGILIGDSCFAVTDRVADLVPELAGSAWEGVSVQDLLDMRVGLAWSEDAGSPDVVPYDHAYQWADSAEGPVSALEYLSRIPRGVGPGGAFAYQSVATDVLAWIIESRTGSRLHDVLSRRLWAPLGAADAEITLDYFGNPMADGGISARAEDLALFGELWRTGGRNREGMRLVPQSWIQTTLTPTPALLDAFARAERPGNRWSTSPYYRNNWWVLDTESRFLAARGYLGQSVHIHGSTGLTVVLLSAWQEHSAERE
ncbi:MAG: serine hydrolase [Actinobacteria bacterium]|nr:serine hydrolase [Actinomycetota bacterium]